MNQYPIIDCHTHTFPDRIASRAVASLSQTSHTVAFTDGTNDGLLTSMNESGVTTSLILPVATKPEQVEKVNNSALKVNESFKGRLVSLGCIHPDYQNVHDELARIRDLGLKGIKIHPVYQGADLDGPQFMRILKEAAQLNLIVVTHAGLDIGFPGVVRCSPQMARHVIEEIGPFSFVLAHMGGWRNWDEVPQYLKGTGVYLDTAFSQGDFQPLDDGYWGQDDQHMLSDSGMMKIIRDFGTDHILFGSDSPWSGQKASLALIRQLPLSEKEKKDILYGNAQKLFQL